MGRNFNPEVGYVRRSDIRRSHAYARFSPRPQAHAHVRKLSSAAGVTYVENGRGQLEGRDVEAEGAIDSTAAIG